MDKQTCAALLNMLGFDSYDMTFEEFSVEFTFTNNINLTNVFLLKDTAPDKVGSVINVLFSTVSFKSYEQMINFARTINETRTK